MYEYVEREHSDISAYFFNKLIGMFESYLFIGSMYHSDNCIITESG